MTTEHTHSPGFMLPVRRTRTPVLGACLSVALMLTSVNCDDRIVVGTEAVRHPGSGGSGKVAQIALGWYHACALLTNGTVSCWGNNYGGQLGDDTTVTHAQPMPVPRLSGVVRIDADYTDSCAMFADGRMTCWGSNNYGQLGDGTVQERHVPTLSLGCAVKQMSLGEYHTCVLLTDNTVSCWGLNSSGQLGDGSTIDRLVPTHVPGVSNVVQIAAGANFGCVLLADATVSCWGTNVGSDVCDGINVLHPNATPMGLSGVAQIAAGSTHACALLKNGTVSCWGLNFHSQLGRDAVCPNNGVPAGAPGVVPGLTSVVQIAAGDGHTCARLKDGTVSCWGRNEGGQLGDGTTTSRSTPTLVAGINSGTQLAVGYADTCVVLDDQTSRCWGQFDPFDNGPLLLTPTPILF